MYRPLLSLLLLPLLSFSLPASAAGVTERQACLKLISAAHALRLAGPDKRGDYRCRRHKTDADFVFTLRFDGPQEPADATHLLGYYAVDPATRDIYEWDITLQKRGAIVVVPQRKKR
jgi:hypothetical protein